MSKTTKRTDLVRSDRDSLESAYLTSLAQQQQVGYWFTPKTMRFFKSRIHDVYTVLGTDGDWVFLTSECAPNSPRRYTVRTMDKTGNIRAPHGYKSFETLRQARAAAFTKPTPATAGGAA